MLSLINSYHFKKNLRGIPNYFGWSVIFLKHSLGCMQPFLLSCSGLNVFFIYLLNPIDVHDFYMDKLPDFLFY